MKALTILIPTDFSDVSLMAFQMADVFAQKLPVQLHLLHVIEANDANPDFFEGMAQSNLKKKEEEALINFNLLKASGRKFEAHITTGLLTDQINQASADYGADIVLMGTKGSAGFMEKISGSEAQHVARYLQIPVLTTRPGTLITGLKNILLVSDFELLEQSIQLNALKTIAEAFDSTLHLLQILKEGDEKYADQIQEQMKLFAKQHGFQRYETHLYRDQKVADGVRNFNQEADMDLVCIGTHGRKGINHLLFGSIAERLVNHCIKPLLTFQLKKHA